MGILLLPPTLDVQSASVGANNSKFQEESTVQLQTTFTLQDTADVPPQMPLVNLEQTNRHKQPTQESVAEQAETAHTRETTRNGYLSVHSIPRRNPSTQWDPQC